MQYTIRPSKLAPLFVNRYKYWYSSQCRIFILDLYKAFLCNVTCMTMLVIPFNMHRLTRDFCNIQYPIYRNHLPFKVYAEKHTSKHIQLF